MKNLINSMNQISKNSQGVVCSTYLHILDLVTYFFTFPNIDNMKFYFLQSADFYVKKYNKRNKAIQKSQNNILHIKFVGRILKKLFT